MTPTRYPPRHATSRPLWEDVFGWGLAILIGVLAAYFLVIGLST